MTLRERLEAMEFTDAPAVACLVEKPGVGIHAIRNRVEVAAGRGFTGDHPKKSWWRGAEVPGRHVTAIAREVIDILDCNADVPGDNLITAGIDLGALAEGDELHIGDVRLRRSAQPHEPCATFARRTSQEAMKAVAKTSTRGALFTVETGGVIRAGDPVTVLSATSGFQPTGGLVDTEPQPES